MSNTVVIPTAQTQTVETIGKQIVLTMQPTVQVVSASAPPFPVPLSLANGGTSNPNLASASPKSILRMNDSGVALDVSIAQISADGSTFSLYDGAIGDYVDLVASDGEVSLSSASYPYSFRAHNLSASGVLSSDSGGSNYGYGVLSLATGFPERIMIEADGGYGFILSDSYWGAWGIIANEAPDMFIAPLNDSGRMRFEGYGDINTAIMYVGDFSGQGTGIKLYNATTASTDLLLQTGASNLGSIRLENRVGYRISANSVGGEFQFISDVSGVPSINAVIGQAVTAFSYDPTTGANTQNSVVIAGATALGQLTVNARNAGVIAEVVRGFSGQFVDIWQLRNSADTVLARFDSTGDFGLNTTTPTAKLHITGGGSGANQGAMKFGSATILTTAEAGAVEYNGVHKVTQANNLRYSLGGVIQTFFATVNNSSTTETDLFSYNTPGSTLAVNGDSLEFFASGTLTNNANTKTIKAYFASVQLLTSTAGFASGAYSWELRVVVTRVSATTARCSANLTLTIDGTATTTEITKYTAVSATFSAGNIIKVTGQSNTASNDVSATHGKVSYTPAP